MSAAADADEAWHPAHENHGCFQASVRPFLSGRCTDARAFGSRKRWFGESEHPRGLAPAAARAPLLASNDTSLVRGANDLGAAHTLSLHSGRQHHRDETRVHLGDVDVFTKMETRGASLFDMPYRRHLPERHPQHGNVPHTVGAAASAQRPPRTVEIECR